MSSQRILVRVVVPSTYRVVKSIVTTPQKCYNANLNSNVTPPPPVFCTAKPRMYSQRQEPAAKSAEEMTVDYEYVKKAITKGTLIIDVREPEEVKEHGKIPNSINIPLANVVPVLSNVSEKEFQDMYETMKPTEETEMIFYCMIGKRSAKAQQNAMSLGYKNAKNYLGSWTDWATKKL